MLQSRAPLAGAKQLRAWLILLTVGCGGGTAAPPSPSSPSTPILATGPERPAHWIGKELFEAEVRIFGVLAGELRTEIDQGCPGEHASMESTMRTAGVVRMLVRRDGEAKSQLDRETLYPATHLFTIDDGEVLRRYDLSFEPGAYTFVYTRTGEPPKQETRDVPRKHRAHDMHSTLQLLRSWRPAQGAQRHFYFVLGRRVWRADVEYGGTETIDVAGEQRRAARIDGMGYKVGSRPGEHDTHRGFQLWFSEDDERIPLRIIADASYGRVRFDLASHLSVPRPCRTSKQRQARSGTAAASHP